VEERALSSPRWPRCASVEIDHLVVPRWKMMTMHVLAGLSGGIGFSSLPRWMTGLRFKLYRGLISRWPLWRSAPSFTLSMSPRRGHGYCLLSPELSPSPRRGHTLRLLEDDIWLPVRVIVTRILTKLSIRH
jgi:hypothetical protein